MDDLLGVCVCVLMYAFKQLCQVFQSKHFFFSDLKHFSYTIAWCLLLILKYTLKT